MFREPFDPRQSHDQGTVDSSEILRLRAEIYKKEPANIGINYQPEIAVFSSELSAGVLLNNAVSIVIGDW